MNVNVRIRICVGIANINKINQCTKKTTQSCMAASFDGKMQCKQINYLLHNFFQHYNTYPEYV